MVQTGLCCPWVFTLHPRNVLDREGRSANISHPAWWWECFSFFKRKKKSLMIDCIFASPSHLLPCNIDIFLSTKMPSVLQTHLFHWLRRGECFDWLHLLSVCVCIALPGPAAVQAQLPEGFFSQQVSTPSDQQNPTQRGAGSIRGACGRKNLGLESGWTVATPWTSHVPSLSLSFLFC